MEKVVVFERKIKREKEIKYNGVTVLIYSITYPQFTTISFVPFIGWLNGHYSLLVQRLISYAENDFYARAVQRYREAKAHNHSFDKYMLKQDYTVTLNQGCIISLYMDTSQNMGEDSVMERVAENWDIIESRAILLEELYPLVMLCKTDIKEEIITRISRQMVYNKMDEYFNSHNFFLTPDYLVVFFQERTIVPYGNDIVRFDIPYVRKPISEDCWIDASL